MPLLLKRLIYGLARMIVFFTIGAGDRNLLALRLQRGRASGLVYTSPVR